MAMVLEGLPFNGYRGHTEQNSTMATSDMAGDMEDVDKYSEEGRRSSQSRLSDGTNRPVSALARGVQITEFAESRVNPTPLLLEESDILLEQYLSPGKLQLLTGVDNLGTVECLELKVDSRETSLGNFGSLLPNLRELKLSGSCISCVRDLGSSLRNLHILWLTRCGLEELDGISSMLNLVELYLEYNEISDLSPLSMLEHLEILDLEGNNIDDVTQVQYLSLCPRLRRLALDGNPVCVYPSPDQDQLDPSYDYRGTVRSILPNLLVLDDERMDADIGGATSSLSPGDSHSRHYNVFDEDWAYLEELQQVLQQDFMQSESEGQAAVADGVRPQTGALRPATSYRPGSALRPSSGFRPLTSSRRRPSTMSPGTPGNHQGNAASTRAVSTSEGIECSSELTMGSVICGNPSKALRQRRQGGPGSKDEIKKGLGRLMQKGAVFSHSEGAEDEPIKAESEMNSIIEELQSWKVDHDKRMKEILKTKEAQILVVDHDEAEDVLTSDEEDYGDFRGSASRYSTDRPPSATQHRHSLDLRLKQKHAGAGAVATSEEKTISKGPRALGKTSAERERLSSDQDIYCYQSSTHKDNLNDSWDDNDSDDSSGELKNRLAATKHSKQVSNTSERTGMPSFSSRPGSSRHQPSLSHTQNGDRPVVSPEGTFPLSYPTASEHYRRPGSRGSTTGELAPLRAPSPTSAQIIKSMRSRQPAQSPPTSPRPRKLRVGPTGLPLSSQTQQPVIRGSIAASSSRGTSAGAAGGLGTPNSRPGVALLPSQPRIPRQLPEPPSLLPRPPPKQS